MPSLRRRLAERGVGLVSWAWVDKAAEAPQQAAAVIKERRVIVITALVFVLMFAGCGSTHSWIRHRSPRRKLGSIGEAVGGVAHHSRHTAQASDDGPGAQPSGCRNTDSGRRVRKSQHQPHLSRFCSLKAALLCAEGSVKSRSAGHHRLHHV